MCSNIYKSYKYDFNKFLIHTNEKAVLYSEILKYINLFKVRSLLDIGPGNGEISIPLSNMVEKYCAVEMNSNFIPKLLNKNLNVIEGEFPLNIENSFDMILASHTISYRHKDFSRYIGAFFKCAWKLLNSGGILLLINSAGNEGEWTTFMNRIGMQEELIPSQKGYKEILLKLRLLGKLSILKIDSFIRTNNIDDMIDSLTFIASKGDPLRKTKFLSNRVKIEEVLKKSYFINNEFVFPLEHYFHILIKK